MNQIGLEVYGMDVGLGCRQWKLTAVLSLLLVLLSVGLTACEQKQLPGPANVQANAPPPQDARTEWAVLIDNSRSISPPEQVLIREATMLLADLADPGDRISVLTFGSQARVAASVAIQNDADRRRFQDLVKAKVDFREGYSDIRAGLRLLVQQREALFPTPNARHAALLLSDGLLEPPNRQSVSAAYQEIKDMVQGPLKNLDLFTIALGVTGSQRNIPGLTPPLTGLQLMLDIAGHPDRFTHAKQLDEVFDAILRTLRRVKGLSASSDTGSSYRIDKTVEAMTLIVRKRSVSGEVYATSQDIQLEPPQAQGALPGASTTPQPSSTIYRNSDYQYFDLFVVRNPSPGEWRVMLKNGKSPKVLSKIDTPIELNTQARPSYYLNESGVLLAWLWDAKQGAVSRVDYQIQAHPIDDKTAQTYLPFTLDEASGQYFLDIPESVKPLLSNAASPTDLELEIKVTQASDPMFLRQTRLKTGLAQPLIEWKQTAAWLERIPFMTSNLEFGGILDTQHPDYRLFDVPPTLKLSIEAFDKDSQQYQPLSTDSAQPQAKGDQLGYTIAKPFTDYRQYRYRYELTGHTAQGERIIKSPWYVLQLRIPWILISIAIGVLLLLLHIAGRLPLFAKLGGRVSENGNKPFSVTGRPSYCYSEGKSEEKVSFCVLPRRTLWFYKRLLLEVSSGTVHIEKWVNKKSVEKRKLVTKQKFSLSQHQLYTIELNQTKIELMNLHVI